MTGATRPGGRGTLSALPGAHANNPSVDPDAKTATVCKRKVDHFHFEVVSGKMILNVQAVVRFGTRHYPFYVCKPLLIRQMSILSVFSTMLACAYYARVIL
jgi:hypothetical protein